MRADRKAMIADVSMWMRPAGKLSSRMASGKWHAQEFPPWHHPKSRAFPGVSEGGRLAALDIDEGVRGGKEAEDV